MKKITLLLFTFLIGFIPPSFAKKDNSKFITTLSTGEGICGDWGFDLSKSKVEAHSAKAVWTYNGDTSNQSTYWMYIKEGNGEFQLKYKYNSYNNVLDFTFADLKSLTEYTIKIERRCNLTKTTKEVSFKTHREPGIDTTPDCISNWHLNKISQTGASESSVKFEWASGGKNATYKIEYRENSHKPWTLHTNSTSATIITISGLPTSTLEKQYEVKVTRTCPGNSGISIVGKVSTKKSGILDCAGLWSLRPEHTSTSKSITLNWNEIGGATYDVWYRVNDAFNPRCYVRSSANATGTSYTVNGLQKSTKYDFVVIKKCPNYTINKSFCPESSFRSEPFNLTNPNISKRSFTTKSSDPTNFVCQAVSGLGSKNITLNSATLFFTKQNYLSNNLEEITYVWEGAGKTKRARHDGSSLNIRDLCSNTTYTYWIEKMCRNQTEPAIEGKKTFTTQNYSTCPTPTGLYFDAANSHIKNRIAWNGDCGIKSYTVQVKKTGTNNWTSFRVNSTELIEAGEWGTNYTARVKANCDGGLNGSGWSNEISFTTSVPCPRVQNLKIVSVVPTGFELEWDESLSMTTSYIIQVKEGNGAWSGDMYNSSSRRLYFTYLTNKHNTVFQFRVRANCENTEWVYTEPTRSWVNPNVTCDIPTGFRKIYIHPTAGKIAWNAASGAIYYRLGILESGTWTGRDVGNVTEFVSNHLTPGKAYAVVVRSECGNGKHSDWSNAIRFTTPYSSSKSSVVFQESHSGTDESIIYPNPNKGNFKIRFGNGKKIKAVAIYNMLGIKIFSKEYDNANQEESFELEDNLSNGMYKIQIRTENGIENKSIIIE